MYMFVDLPLIWAGIIAFGVFMYVLLDGFDLGIGILFPLAQEGSQRDIMMNSVAPVWDGNETWLVMGGAALFGAFPLAYSLLLPALYLPIMAMLFALILRGVSFEFRFRSSPANRAVWDWCFAGGSAVAAFAQGVVLGAFVQGFEVSGGAIVGGAFDWLSLFSAMTGFALVFGYALLGATWLIIKAEGPLQDWAFAIARRLVYAVLMFIALVSLWTPLTEPEIYARWFSWPNIAFLIPVPIVTALIAFLLLRCLAARWERAPFYLSIALFGLSYLGLGVSLFPYLVPRALTIWDTAAPPESQMFLLVGVVILIPIILFYTAYAYSVFRGKVRAGEGYH